MKFSEIKNEEALDVLADIIEPASTIMQDKEIADGFRSGKSRMKIISVAINRYKKEIIQILAAMDRKPVEEYECNVLTLPIKVLELLNDKELVGFFSFSAETGSQTSSGSATENTAEGETAS